MLHKSLRNDPRQQSITIVLEWENAEGLERDEALYFLRRLAANIRDSGAPIPRPVTLLLVFDEGVDQAELQAILAECAAEMCGCLTAKLLRAPGAMYYEKKGIAPFFVDSDIIVYADSDCRYCDNWLSDLLAPLLSHSAELAHGSTFALEDKGIVAKTSALAWFFPIASPSDPLTKKNKPKFFANNFAVRRSAIAQVPIPRLRASRAHGSRWLKSLHAAGLRTQFVASASAEHKQYDAYAKLLARAWLLGTDKDAAISAAGASRPYRIWRSLTGVLDTNLRFFRRYFSVGLSRVTMLDAIPVLVGGVMFQMVVNLAHFGSAVSQPRATVSTDYSELIACANMVGDQQQTGPTPRAAA